MIRGMRLMLLDEHPTNDLRVSFVASLNHIRPAAPAVHASS